MAGPYTLAPQQIKTEIPTWNWPGQTKVIVDAKKEGYFEMTAGGSSTETNKLKKGRNEFSRSFGGVYLAVKNLTPQDITVWTE